MKRIHKLLGLGFLVPLLYIGCRKTVDIPLPNVDLGIKSNSTGIKAVVQTGNNITAVFTTTPGAKYSVQIVPFGSDQPIKTEGFTATDTTTRKIFNLGDLTKKDYDLIFIDILGKEVKHPIVIK
jgi:hypothetical protein